LKFPAIQVHELPSQMGCLVLVPGRTIPVLQGLGLPTDGLRTGKITDLLPMLDRPVLFAGTDPRYRAFMSAGWTVDIVPITPLFPEVNPDRDRPWRPYHVPGCQPVWLLATPPG
jgi:hypothetical protein